MIKTKGDKMKKSQGLSLNMVAGAVIVLTVVIVLIIIFTGKMSLFSRSISGCESKPGAVCKTACFVEGDSVYYSQQIDFRCPKEKPICCYSQCRAAGGKCDESACGEKDDLGTADCVGGKRCCK